MRILRTSRNATDCLFSTIPKGLRIGRFSLQMWLSHFGAKAGQPHCISTCLRAARYRYLPILKRKIWGKAFQPPNLTHVVTFSTREAMGNVALQPPRKRKITDNLYGAPEDAALQHASGPEVMLATHRLVYGVSVNSPTHRLRKKEDKLSSLALRGNPST